MDIHPLSTILDLAPEDFVEIPSFSPHLALMIKMARTDLTILSPVDMIPFLEDEKHTSLTNIMLQRLVQFCPEVKLSVGMCGSIEALSGNKPGLAVLWAHTVAAMWYRTNQPVTTTTLFIKQFDGCLPKPTALETLWSQQKLSYTTLVSLRQKDPMASDNALDYPDAWTPEALALQKTHG
jgi:hypothetical protein